MKPSTVKNVIKEEEDLRDLALYGDTVKIASTFAEEFIQFISLAAADRSERPNQWIDSQSIIRALNDLGFGEIASMVPEIEGNEHMVTE